ncbi:MAG: hypothetical protein ACI3YK_06545 [Eubacteriales bacterium]
MNNGAASYRIPVLKYCPVADTEALLNDFREMLENGYPVTGPNPLMSRHRWITFEPELSDGTSYNGLFILDPL